MIILYKKFSLFYKMIDYYKILKLKPSDDTETIKKKIKQLYNSLSNNDTNKEKKKKFLANAYHTLTDYHKRRDYDQQLETKNYSIVNPFLSMINTRPLVFNPASLNIFDQSKDSNYQNSTSVQQIVLNGMSLKKEKQVETKNGKTKEKVRYYINNKEVSLETFNRTINRTTNLKKLGTEK